MENVYVVEKKKSWIVGENFSMSGNIDLKKIKGVENLKYIRDKSQGSNKIFRSTRGRGSRAPIRKSRRKYEYFWPDYHIFRPRISPLDHLNFKFLN